MANKCSNCGKEIDFYVLEPRVRHSGGQVECNNSTHSTKAEFKE